MDDTERLRRTVRRCTAVLVAGSGVATWAISDIGSARYGFLLAIPALLYLGGSLVFVPAASTAAGESDSDEPGT